MSVLNCNDKSYELDSEGFLVDFELWDEDFADALGPRVKIANRLTDKHWDVIRYIRRIFEAECRCPLIYETCRANGLNLASFKNLFPTGYLRGACRLAGITYVEGYIGRICEGTVIGTAGWKEVNKVYPVNGFGFLVDAYLWDRQFAELKAFELKMPDHLTDDHWQVIRFLRDYYDKNYRVPSIYETCEANDLELEDLEKLFPDGYHRGAVKIAGLRAR